MPNWVPIDLSTELVEQGFDDAFDELVESLVVLREWFGHNGPRHWLHELDQDLALLRRHDAYGLDRFLGHFGSIGSIGNIGVGEAESLLSRAHLLATVLRRSIAR